MSNGELCCAAGVCCPAASVERKVALVQMFMGEHPSMTLTVAEMAAESVIANFDTLPKGTVDLEKLIRLIEKHKET